MQLAPDMSAESMSLATMITTLGSCMLSPQIVNQTGDLITSLLFVHSSDQFVVLISQLHVKRVHSITLLILDTTPACEGDGAGAFSYVATGHASLHVIADGEKHQAVESFSAAHEFVCSHCSICLLVM